MLSDSARQSSAAAGSSHSEFSSSSSSSFNSSSKLRVSQSQSANSRIRKQPEMPPRPLGGELVTNNGCVTVHHCAAELLLPLLAVLILSSSALTLLNCQCQRLTSS